MQRLQAPKADFHKGAGGEALQAEAPAVCRAPDLLAVYRGTCLRACLPHTFLRVLPETLQPKPRLNTALNAQAIVYSSETSDCSILRSNRAHGFKLQVGVRQAGNLSGHIANARHCFGMLYT